MSVQKHFAVIGAGLAGLTAAYRLQQPGHAVTVFESEAEVGGRTKTVCRDGYTIDTGASAVVESYHEYKALLDEVGLMPALKPASNVVGVVREARIYELHTVAMVRSALCTGLLSWPAKLRLLRAFFDVHRARRRGQLEYTALERAAALDFETARDYALRRLDAEVADYFCDPLIRAMQLADADKISKVEFFSGIANIFRVRLYGLEGGVQRLALALAARVPTRTRCAVRAVREYADGVELLFAENGVEQRQHFDGVVVACPLPAAAAICDAQSPARALHAHFGYGQSITVAFGLRRRPHTRAYLLEVPKRESADVALLMVEHNKLEDAAPPGGGLVVACWEAAAAGAMIDASDDEIIARTQPLLTRVMPEIADAIALTHVTRWRTALPFNAPGSFAAIGRFNAQTRKPGRLCFAGDYTSAPGQNNAVASGNRAAQLLLAAFAA